MKDLAVIIVSWNTCQLTVDTLRTLYADLQTSGLNAEVIVVDNASSDGTVEAIRTNFPQVNLIASEENLGFVGGNNRALLELGFGASITDNLPKAVYLLNPDTLTQPGATQALFDFLMSKERVGLVGAQLAYEDGRFQHGAFHFPGLRQLWVEFFPTPGRLIESPFNGRYPRAKYANGEPFPVDFVLGATMMLKREVVQRAGMFDDAFFMYCEEIDWAWRIHKAGWQVYCVPGAHVIHLSGKSTSQVRPKATQYLWESRLRLFKKHYPAWKRWFAKRMVVAGMHRKIRQTRDDVTLRTEDKNAMVDAYVRIIALYTQDSS